MARLLETLREEHGGTVSLLLALSAQIDDFEGGTRPDYDIVLAALEYFETFPDLYHHPKEDLVYARLRERDAASADEIGDLERAHRDLSEGVKKFASALRAVLNEAELPRSLFVERARRFVEAQRDHIRMEEDRFFPAAERLLTEADWRELEAQIGTAADPLLGGRAGARFERLRQAILSWQVENQTAAATHP